MEEKSLYYSCRQVAEMLGVDPQTVRNLVKKGLLKAIRMGEKGSIRISASEFDRFLEEERKRYYEEQER